MASASDDFNRADNADIGTTWDVQTGSNPFKIVSNAATPNSLAADSAETYNGITFANDQFSQVTLTAVTGHVGADDTGIGVGVRMAAAAATQYRIIGDDSSSIIAKVVSGAYTKLTSNTTGFTAGDVLYGEASGTTITGKKNGAANLSTTDAAIGSGRAGIIYSSSITAATIDNWSGGDLSAADTLMGAICT